MADATEPVEAAVGMDQDDAPGGLAEDESALRGDGCVAGEQEQALCAVLERAAIRPPRKPKERTAMATWVAMGVTPLELDEAIERARGERAKMAFPQPLNIPYVASIVLTARSEVRRAVEGARRVAAKPAKKPGERDVEALARALGMWPSRPGETWPVFTARVLAAAEAQMGRGDG